MNKSIAGGATIGAAFGFVSIAGSNQEEMIPELLQMLSAGAVIGGLSSLRGWRSLAAPALVPALIAYHNHLDKRGPQSESPDRFEQTVRLLEAHNALGMGFAIWASVKAVGGAGRLLRKRSR